MAKETTIEISQDFPFEKLEEAITELYEDKGFKVKISKMKDGRKITVEKGVGGINTVLGLGKRAVANVTVRGKEHNKLSICCSVADGEWTGKVVGGILGLFLCWIPAITAAIGLCGQLSLNGELFDEIESAASSIGE